VPDALPAVAYAAAYTAEVVALGRAGGLHELGIASAEPLLRARQALEERRAAGLHDGMRFTYTNPVRATTPDGLVRDATAMVVGARSYRSASPARASGRAGPVAPAGPAGRVARYAWRDHYGELRQALGVVARRLRADGYKAVVFADDNGLVDREAAYRAGIGWFGKNANLLLPGRGSWFVLGAVVTTAPLVPADEPLPDGCGTCRRCLDGCPTGAIVRPGVIDASRCLAWLLQKPGPFPRQHRIALGDRIYGCDDCQEVCPPNVRADRTDPPPSPSDGDEVWVSLVGMLDADDRTLLDERGRWYVYDREPRWLRRNALVALGNAATPVDTEPQVVDVLRRYLGDRDPLLRAHALWAAARLGRADLVALVADDPDPLVRSERASLPVELRV
jgi:epoxyqueuosine reductase